MKAHNYSIIKKILLIYIISLQSISVLSITKSGGGERGHRSISKLLM